MKEVLIWETEDGQRFADRSNAAEHEINLRNKASLKRKKEFIRRVLTKSVYSSIFDDHNYKYTSVSPKDCAIEIFVQNMDLVKIIVKGIEDQTFELIK